MPYNQNSFIVGDLLLSVFAEKKPDSLILNKFCNYGRYLKKKQGLIFNFNALHPDFRYFTDIENCREAV